MSETKSQVDETDGEQMIQRGDVFSSDWVEYRVKRVNDLDDIVVENLMGCTERKSARELVEVVTHE